MSALDIPGFSALQCVISSLRDTAHFTDEEGDLTDKLRDLRDWVAIRAAVQAAQPAPALSDAEIIAIRKAQVGRYGSAGPAPYADSIQFARAIEQAIGRASRGAK